MVCSSKKWETVVMTIGRMMNRMMIKMGVGREEDLVIALVKVEVLWMPMLPECVRWYY